MNWIKRKTGGCILLFSVVLLASSYSVANGFAAAGKDFKSLKSTMAAAKSTLSTFKMLGISSLKCSDCSFIMMDDDNERFWNFSSEPKILKVDSNGPAHRKLKKGDEIVAVDGMLITTRRAGQRLAEIAPGEDVELTVRRGRRTITETITAREPESDEEFELEGLDNTFTIEIGKLSKDLESLARHAQEISVSIGSVDVPELPAITNFPEWTEELGFDWGEHLRGDYLPRGWFGFALSFSGSIKRQEGGPAQWRFDKEPEIEWVDDDSPADRAGLKPGDVITHVDGTKITRGGGGEKFSDVEPGQNVTWTIKRGGETFDVDIEAVERPEKTPSLVSVTRAGADAGHKLRYTGSLGDTDIEVRGDDSVDVTVDKDGGVILIKSRGATVRVKLSEGKD